MKTGERWTSKLGFILASAGAAIGIGAIWKFPNVVATNGGGAFFFVFILFTFGIGLPLLLAEFLIGRGTGKEAVAAYRALAPHSYWHWIGYWGVAACALLLSFYSVVGGWILLYFIRSISGTLLRHSGGDYGQLFTLTTEDGQSAVLSQAVFMLLTSFIVAKGIKKGIERASFILMPSLFLLLLMLIVRSLTLPGTSEGLVYFLQPDFNKLSAKVLLSALGQSCFCLSVGVSCMVTYSSYLDKRESLSKPALSVVSLNVMASFMAGIAIFPALFALGMEPVVDEPKLLFITLPKLFEQLPYGSLFLALFFALFLFATLTSAFSLLEIVVAAFARNDGVRRQRMCWLLGMIIFLLGIPSALSFGIGHKIVWMNKNIFQWVDFIVTNVMLPLGALCLSLFVGFRYPRQRLREEWRTLPHWWQRGLPAYVVLLRYLLPFIIAIVFLRGMNWLPI